MKFSTFCIILVISISASFIFGAYVGANKQWILSESHSSNLALLNLEGVNYEFESIEQCEENISRKNKDTLHKGILSFGRYHESWYSDIPILPSYDSQTYEFFKRTADYYERNNVNPYNELTKAELIAKLQRHNESELHDNDEEKTRLYVVEDYVEKRHLFNRAMEELSK
jgi:hypothetical protein